MDLSDISRARHAVSPTGVIMRSLLLALALCSSPALADVQPVDAPAKPAPKATHDFPVPKDAAGGDSQPGGGGKILMYKIPRGRDAVVTETKEALTKGGWKIDKETKSPSGNAVRLEVTKGGKLYKASFTGDASQAALILTLP
jgi:hypothetical protein